jgi:hypothetical protein
MSFVAKMLNALNRYPETFQAQETWDELGKPTNTIEKYAEKVSS